VIRVLFVSKYFDHIHNGPGAQTRLLFDACAQGRWPNIEFHLLTPDTESDLVSGNAHVHKLQDVRVTHPRTSNWRFQWLLRKAIPEVARTAGCQVIHFDTAFFATLAIGDLRKRSWPVVVNVNDYYDETFAPLDMFVKGVRDWWMRMTAYQCERRVVRRAERVLFVSKFNLDSMCMRWALPREKARLAYCAVDESQFTPSRTNVSYRRSLEALFVGYYWRRKGLPDLIEALADPRLVVRLSVVGPPPSQFPHIQELIDQHGVAGKVRLCGLMGRDSLANIYRESDVLVLPSLREALGVVALEAMASGLPVVASTVGGLPEIVHHDETGLLIAPKSARAIADALVLLQDVDYRKRLSEKALVWSQRFAVGSLTTRLDSIYRELIEGCES
jgi:glycosyltransferase involved in cell wall biosynthesis